MTTKARTFQVTFYTSDPARLAAFWASALGYIDEPPPDGFDSWDEFARKHDIPEDAWNAMKSLVHPEGTGPRLLFWRVKGRKPAKNYVHLDINAWGGASGDERRDALRAETDHLVDLGGTLVREVETPRDYWIAMADPDGNEFSLQ